MSTPADDVQGKELALARLAALADSASSCLLVAGAGTIVLWQTGTWLVLAGFVGIFATHLTVGIVGYRQVMRRPWPQVEPLDPHDDDDW